MLLHLKITILDKNWGKSTESICQTWCGKHWPNIGGGGGGLAGESLRIGQKKMSRA
jgi:hypothetical protein